MAAYNEWVTNFGRTQSGSGGFESSSVPEPGAGLLALLGIYMLSMRRVTLTAWTRQL
jgi:hypothetical protein